MSRALEDELRGIIVVRLELDGVRPEDIDADAPLFVEGLGLDSIDALELAAALEERYGITITAGAAENATVFRSLRSLAAHVEAHRVH